jgi:hypothetical protein
MIKEIDKICPEEGMAEAHRHRTPGVDMWAGSLPSQLRTHGEGPTSWGLTDTSLLRRLGVHRRRRRRRNTFYY